MISRSVFIDTWGWIALGHRSDPRHTEVSQFYQALRTNNALIYTSDYVLDEVVTLLFRREVFHEALRFVEGILAAATQGYLSMERITPERFMTAWDLRLRFKDKPQISFTDLTSMAVMSECRIKQVLTEDKHFFEVGMGLQRVP